MKPRTVQLEGGPFDGRFMLAADGPMLAVIGDPLPAGMAARYLRRADDPSRYRYSLDVTVTQAKSLERAA